MCDGSNTFYCESGGVCNEIVQGENYTCTCPPGFAGEHCNFAGELCGDIYCYNGGICHQAQGSSSCDCPSKFHGSKDCSVSAAIVVQHAPPPKMIVKSKHGINEWWVPLGVVLAIIFSISCVSGLALRSYKRRMSQIPQIRFQELREMKLSEGEDFISDDEDKSFQRSKEWQWRNSFVEG